MTAGGYGYDSLRATDADRSQVQAMLENAYAEGRLSWEEFDSRTTRLLSSYTYGQLASLTSDLPGHAPAMPPQVYQPYQPAYQGPPPTNGLAIAALVCGIAQFCGLWLFGTIPALVLGHKARRQIRQTGEQGMGMATAGIALGWIGIGLSVLVIGLIIVALIAGAAGSGSPAQPGP